MKETATKSTKFIKIMFLVGMLLFSVMVAWSRSESITVTRSGELKDKILQIVDLKNVTELRVSGPLSFDDLNELSNLDSLEILNLEKAIFQTMTGCKDMSKLRQVFLPECVEEIGDDAFRNCGKLSSITLPEVRVIGESAFNGCSELFNVVLPSTLKEIKYQAFYHASLNSITIPEGVERLASYCLCCENLEIVRLPSTLKELGNSFWYWGRNLKEVYYKGTNPLSTETFEETQGSLYIPKCSIAAFKSDYNWNKFKNIIPYFEASDIYIPFTHTNKWGFETFFYDLSTEGIVQGAKMHNQGNLRVDGYTPIRLSTYKQSFGSSYLDGLPTMVVNAPLTSLNAELVHRCGSEIAFFSSPFDIRIKDIQIEEGTHLVVREYDAKRRAALRKDVWKTLGPDDVMKAGKGYVLFTDVEDVNENGTFIFSGDPSKGTLFATDDVIVKLDSWPSELPHASNWNVVANPYPCYFSINDIEHDGVLTIWDGYRYVAYSTVDDTGYLKPFRGFFVQRTSSPEIKFRASGRYRDTDGKRIAPVPQTSCMRKVFNFMMYANDNEEVWDRARIVFNPDASIEYDMRCDAPKFDRIGEKAFEIYINDDGMKMSIDERPEDDGTAFLGVFIPKEDEYRISLDSKFVDDVFLHDILTGEVIKMGQNDYVFHSEAGDFPDRFEVFIGETNGVAAGYINDETLMNTEVFTMGGVKVGSRKASKIDLKPGVYIERIGNQSRKTIIK